MKQINKKNFRKSIIVTSLLTISIPLSACSILPKEEEVIAPPLVEPAKVEYDVVEVERGDVIKRLTGNANFVPISSENLYFEQNGSRLQKVHVAEGDLVEKGQTLVEINNGSLTYDIEQLELDLEKAKIRLDQLEAQKADEYSLEIAELDIDSIELRLNQLRQQYAASQITAPIDGIVTFVTDIKPGEFVESFTSMVQVADTSNLQLIYSATNSTMLSDITVGMPVTITISGEKVEGEIAQTPDTVPDDIAEKDPNLYERSLIISLKDSPVEVEVGDSAEIEVVIAEKKDTLFIPKNGLRQSAGRNYVQLLVDKTKREKDIEVGVESATEIEVLKGLEEGDKVILK